MTTVPTLDATAPVAGLFADAETTVHAWVGSAGVCEDLAMVAPITSPAQAEEARAIGTLLAGAAVPARVASAGIAPLELAETALTVARAAAVEVEAVTTTLPALKEIHTI